jgi:hypothetical protein
VHEPFEAADLARVELGGLKIRHAGIMAERKRMRKRKNMLLY